MLYSINFFMIIWFFFFFFKLTLRIPFIYFQMLKQSYIPGIKPYLVMIYFPLLYWTYIYIWIQLLNFYSEVLHLCSWGIMTCSFLLFYFFLVTCWSVFGYQDNPGFIGWVGKHFLLFNPLKDFVQKWYNFIFKHCVEFSSEGILGLEISLLEGFTTKFISLIDKGLLRWFFSWVRFGMCIY